MALIDLCEKQGGFKNVHEINKVRHEGRSFISWSSIQYVMQLEESQKGAGVP